jgi:hypothetical protein
MTIDGNATTIHHNGTDKNVCYSGDYGLYTFNSGCIHLVSPLTKEMISTNNHRGRNYSGTIQTITNNNTNTGGAKPGMFGSAGGDGNAFGGGAFGAPTNNNNTNNTGGFGNVNGFNMFGGNNTMNKPAANTMFGSSQAAQQGAFGNNNNNNAQQTNTGFGGSGFGAATGGSGFGSGGFGAATGGGFRTGGFDFGSPPQNKMDAFGSSAATNNDAQGATNGFSFGSTADVGNAGGNGFGKITVNSGSMFGGNKHKASNAGDMFGGGKTTDTRNTSFDSTTRGADFDDSSSFNGGDGEHKSIIYAISDD